MKKFADLKREEREFAVGDQVYVKLQPYRQNSVALRKNVKLAARYYGPFEVLEKIGQVAYRVNLPDSSRIHPVFHVSLLKKCLKRDIVPISALPAVNPDGSFIIFPQSVLDNRNLHRHGREVPQILINWVNLDALLVSWEDLHFIRKKFPSFNPCGQGLLKAGGIVREKEEIQSGEKVVFLAEEMKGIRVCSKVKDGGNKAGAEFEGEKVVSSGPHTCQPSDNME